MLTFFICPSCLNKGEKKAFKMKNNKISVDIKQQVIKSNIYS